MFWISIGVLLLAAMPGCRAAPDLRSFDEATDALAASIGGAGELVALDVERSTRSWPQDDRARADAIAAGLRAQWTSRAGVAGAMRDYSATLVEIGASGDGAERDALELADAIGRLSAAVDLAAPPSRTGVLGVRAGAAVYGAFARDLAARKIGARMTDATPAVDALLAILDTDLADLDDALAALADQAAFTIDERVIDGLHPRTERGAARALTLRQNELRTLLGLGAARGAAIEDPDRDAIMRELASVEASLALGLRRLEPIDAAIVTERARLDRDRAAIALMRTGLRDWGAAHARTLEACQRGTGVRVDDLTSAADRLRLLILETRTFAHGGN